ncbi:transporter substrate-binding domain-containing protein [Maridesulfovibrio sp.]|uniref:substrate-binding periplasmic protein n=1 Tax=Maridesulfovibrio sp. TaxID=2795000 RepID=UPI0029CA8363|nr:transporter substrate-binding domain-containing protein [Maridesulfovibrio sp.]
MKKVIVTIMISLLLMPTCAFAKKKLIFATDSFPPFYYPKNGSPAGIQYELAKIVFNRMNTNFKIIFVPWKRALMMAEAGKVDGVFGLRKTKERERWLIYPEEPLMHITAVIFKHADDPFEYKGISSLAGKTIGITKGYTYGKEFDESSLFIKEEVSDLHYNFLKLLAGRIDLVAAYRTVGIHTLNEMHIQDRVTICPEAVYLSPLYIGFSRKPGNGEISLEFSRILTELKKSDECAEIMRRIGVKPELISPCK